MSEVFIDKHESYGLIQISRIFHDSHLFGSDIAHSSAIRLKIKNALVKSSDGTDFYVGTDSLIEVDMSASQFAEAITNLNSAEGTPVTIRRFNGKPVADCPFNDSRDKFAEALSENLNEVDRISEDLMDDVKELFAKKSLTKADKDLILSKLESLRLNIGSNRNYIFSAITEQMEKTVAEAKAEVNSYIQLKKDQYADLSLATSAVNILDSE